MMLASRQICYGLLFLALCVISARAEEAPDDGTLRVSHITINAEQGSPEICLEFNHAFDLTDRGRVAANIRLKKQSEDIPISSQNLSLSDQLLCVQSLEHGLSYHLAISNLHRADNKTSVEPFALTFTVPDRPPSLVFVNTPDANGMMRLRDSDPTLRVVNVGRVHIALYRVTEPSDMAAAWRQRLQTNLAPSESMTFASTHGTSVWQGDLVLNDLTDKSVHNKMTEFNVPLRAVAGPLPHGLYFLAVASSDAKTATAPSNLLPMAALWFTLSDLELHTEREDGGFYAQTALADATGVADNVRLILTDHDEHTLIEGHSAADGTSYLPLPVEKKSDADLLLALSDRGDVDFNDALQDTSASYFLPAVEAQLIADRVVYTPGATAQVILIARNAHGEGVATDNSKLALLRPDHTTYAEFSASPDVAGVAGVSITLPPIDGLWTLVWQQADGRELAKIPLRTSSNNEAPRLEIKADKNVLGSDGNLNLNLKTLTYKNNPSPYIAGHITALWQKPAPPSPVWADYHFGGAEVSDNKDALTASFITDSHGLGTVHLSLAMPSESPVPPALALRVQSGSVFGVQDPEPLVLPVEPENYEIGIRPYAADGKFAENSLAQFDIVALNNDGNRKAADSLNYQIYEEGRSFDWDQADGHWTYKPLQQHRRIGGGQLALKATGNDVISWPVTTGTYALDIADANGALLAHYVFDAGWNQTHRSSVATSSLNLKPSVLSAQPGEVVKLAFSLDKPAVVTFIVADDIIRKLIHRYLPAGDNVIEFTPEESWGDHVGVWLRAESADVAKDAPLGLTISVAAGQIVLPIQHHKQELTLSLATPDHITSGHEVILPFTVQNLGPQQPAHIRVLAVPDQSGTTLASIMTPIIEAGPDGKAELRLNLPDFFGTLQLTVLAWNQSQWGQKQYSIPARPAFAIVSSAPASLRPNDSFRLLIDLKNYDAPTGSYRYTLSATTGINVSGMNKGVFSSAPDQSQKLSFDIHALEPSSGFLKLEILGPNHLQLTHSWPLIITPSRRASFNVSEQKIMPQQSWSLLAGPKSQIEKSSLFLSPKPLFGAPSYLASLSAAEPYSSSELASWLEAARLWQNVITQSGLAPEGALQNKRKNILTQLLRRQNSDGGFPLVPNGISDLESTANVLQALTPLSSEPVVQLSSTHAADWLQHRLENAWFDEAERSSRAIALAALADNNRLDVSALRYFAETSHDKALSLEALAALANALVKIGDQDKADIWLNAAREKLKTADTEDLVSMARFLRVITANPLLNTDELQPQMQLLADSLAQHPTYDFVASVEFLRALWTINDRIGLWRAVVNGVEKSGNGAMVVTSTEKRDAIIIHNPLDYVIYITKADPSNKPYGETKAVDVVRHIYRPDGTLLDPNTPLTAGETYLVSLESSSPTPTQDTSVNLFLVREMPAPALYPVSCALDNIGKLAAPWGWLGDLTLTPTESCEISGHEVRVTLMPPETGPWRLIYMARADQAGSFELTPVALRLLSNHEIVLQNKAEAIQIK